MRSLEQRRENTLLSYPLYCLQRGHRAHHMWIWETDCVFADLAEAKAHAATLPRRYRPQECWITWRVYPVEAMGELQERLK